MANWVGKKIEFQDHHTRYRDEKPSIQWFYQSTADVLRIEKNFPKGFCAYSGNEVSGSNNTILMGDDEANALLKTLLEWDKSYNSGHLLNNWLEENE